MTFSNALPKPPYKKEPLKKVAVFGAHGHIGEPLVKHLRFYAPQISLRLLSSSEGKAAELRSKYPGAEVVVCDIYDQASLDAALDGIDGAFINPPMVCDEKLAMTNLVKAVQKSGTMRHMVRLVGLQPDTNNARIPQALLDHGKGIEIQHQVARQVLDDAQMPVTYLNSGASFMDNMLKAASQIKEGVIIWPSRVVPYIDPRDIGEAAAKMLLSDDARHIHQFYTMNNGEDPLDMDQVANIFQDVLLRPVRADYSEESVSAFFKAIKEAGAEPSEGFFDYFPEFIRYEQANEPIWVPNKFLERTLGRKPTSLRAWIMEHRHHFEPDEEEETVVSHSADQSDNSVQTDTVDGVWEVTVNTPMGKEVSMLTLKSDANGGLSGENKNNKTGDIIVIQEGRVEGNTLTWKQKMTKPIKMDLKVSVQVNGHEFKGHAKAGLLGKSALVGQKKA